MDDGIQSIYKISKTFQIKGFNFYSLYCRNKYFTKKY